MEEILLKYPELRQKTLVEILDEFSPLSYIGITALSLSILLSLQILVYHLKPTFSKLKFDGHFQMRFAVVILLIVNRLLHLVYLLSMYNKYSVEHLCLLLSRMRRIHEPDWPDYALIDQLYQEQTDQESNMEKTSGYILVAFFCTLNIMLILMLFLTMNRYKRVAMVLPQSFEFKVCKCIQIMAILFALYNTITVSLMQTLENYAINIKEEYLLLMDYKMYFKVGSFAFLYIIYYAFTVRLVVLSVRSGQITTQGFSRQIFNRIWKRTSGQPHESSRVYNDRDKSQSQANETINQGTPTLQLRRLYAGMKMIGIFALLSVADLFIFSFLIYSYVSGTFTALKIDPFVAMAASWIVVHIWCVFLLLDMFVKDLMKANNREKSSYVTKFATMIKRFWKGVWNRHHTLWSRSDTTDIVDLSLISSTQSKSLTIYKGKENLGPFVKRTPVLADNCTSAGAQQSATSALDGTEF